MAVHRRPEREQYWREVVRDQAASGLSIAAFCRERGVSPASFFDWRRKLLAGGGEEAVAAKFMAIELPPRSTIQSCLEVALPNGLRVLVPSRFDADALRTLLDVLGVPAC
jgi:transposase-like protein